MSLSPTIAVWLLALAGPTVGFAHLLGVYGLASLEEGPAGVNGLAVRAAIALTTLTATLVDLALLATAWRNRLPRLAKEPDDEAVRFWRATVGIGAGISLITVLWQGLAALIVP
jgi:hypothetical protein